MGTLFANVAQLEFRALERSFEYIAQTASRLEETKSARHWQIERELGWIWRLLYF
jgi:hypothetical protein